MDQAFHLTIDSQGIARLIFDYPNEKINKLSIEALEEFEGVLDRLEKDSHVKILVLSSAKDGIFIAGADVKSFDKLMREASFVTKTISMGHRVMNKLENLPFPSVAVIDGACLGGGLELALACTYRVVGDSPKTTLGLPETTIGIFPGFGGTQRLPRLVGFTQGLTMILSGAPVDAKKAFKIKLADAVYSSGFLKEGVEDFLNRSLSEMGKKEILQRRKMTGTYSFLFEKNFLGRAVVCFLAKRNVKKKTKGFYPAPFAAIDLVQNSFSLPLSSGLKNEEEAFIKSAQNGTFRYVNNLLHIFFNSEAVKKDPGFLQGNRGEKVIKSVGVLGSGTMGNGISWLMSHFEIPVRMKDINNEALGKGLYAIWETYKTLIKIGKINKEQANKQFHNVSAATDYKGFHHLDLVIEAAVESLELKHKIFQEVEAEIRPDAILASNTSSYTIKELGPSLKHPERFLGMHFFNPPSRMPLVEIVWGEKTLPEVVFAAVELCKKLKKMPIVVKDCTGFLVNRIFVRGFSEVIRMLEEGVEIERLDRVIVKFGMPMAPFVLADEVGNDVNLKVFQSLAKAYPDRIKVPAILIALNQHKLFGKKSGAGFYLHDKNSHKLNPQIKELLGVVLKKSELSDEDILDRLMLAMICEASLCLEEKIVKGPGVVDIALVYGIGFPPFRGGILRYADSLGISTVVDKLKKLEVIHGIRYAPTHQLLEMEKNKKSFF